MVATVERIEISRRPEEVFTYVLEPLYSPQWDDSVVAAHREGLRGPNDDLHESVSVVPVTTMEWTD